MYGIEEFAIDTLLENGVPLPIKAPLLFRAFGQKKLLIHQPALGNKLRINKIYLRMKIPVGLLYNTSQQTADQLMVDHGYSVCRVMAIGLFKGILFPWLFQWPMAFWIMWNLKPQTICGATNMLVLYSGTSDFLDTTRCIESMMITAPNLGRTAKRS